MFQLTRSTLRRSALTQSRQFTASAARFVSVGDSIPTKTLFEGSPGNGVDLSEETAHGKSIIIGVPGAFSPACSASHIPGFLKNFSKFNDKGYSKVFVVSVNDPFVQSAWGKSLAKDGAYGDKLRFLADTNGEFSQELDLTFDATKIFGNARSKRYVLFVDNGKVTKTFIEPDNTGVDVSSAEKVLGEA
ncbi:peroxiredoxin Ahp1p [[Candida] railenensis]|uniref:Peroxiredoxin Ahp1p n=1 Tax=[Candida] railenensis TaxID=45579 RepID=A0A9P0QJA9_9ASCO|nr:peroxiredoxin Ahp1p [[Candida] railenensis]